MPFLQSEIDFSQAQTLSLLVSDYLAKKENVKSYYSFFPDSSGFKSAIESRRNSPVDRKVLVDVLRAQQLNPGEKAKKNIELLLEENSFTVTTGHQLNLFTGPLYFIYKILSAIKLSTWLKENFPRQNFIPVYWMASEDHDIEEIDHTFIYGKRIAWNSNGKGAAGRLSSEGIGDVIDGLESVLGETPQARQLISVMKQAYVKENSLSRATRILAENLFSEYGLVIIDADDKQLKKLFVPVLKEELIEQTSYHQTSSAIAELEKSGYEVQVRPREINLFYLGENFRERIVKQNGNYEVLNTSITWDEKSLLNELNSFPERFSPNVVLRPLYQETVLPGIAYVGGPAEIAYWLEYKKTFDHYKVSFPCLVLRNCAMLIDESSIEKMDKLKISDTDLFKSYDVLAREFVQRSQDSFAAAEELNAIIAAYDSLSRRAKVIDPTMVSAVEAEKQKQLNAIRALEEKMIRAQKKKNETSLQQIQKLKDKFFPEGTLQERRDNFIPWYLKHNGTFFDRLLGSFQPVPDRFHVITA